MEFEKQIEKYSITLSNGKKPSIIIEFQVEPNLCVISRGHSYEDRKLAVTHYEEIIRERDVRIYLINRKQNVQFSYGEAKTVPAKKTENQK